MIKNICKICEKEFIRLHNPKKIFKYCSIKCMGKDTEKAKSHSLRMKGKIPWNKGVKGIQPWMNISGLNSNGSIPWNKNKTGIYSKETLESNRKKHLGISPPNKGVPMSDLQKKKLSLKKLGKKGKDSNAWRGGLTIKSTLIRASLEGKLWIRAILERDMFTCQKCKVQGRYFNAHHILNFSKYPEFRFAIDNGITLCKKCHKNFHTKYGKKNNTKGQLQEFLAEA